MFPGYSALLGQRAKLALLVVFSVCTLTLVAATSARADWNPLAPITGPTTDFGNIAVEYNPDGAAASIWAVDFGASLEFNKYSADGQTLIDSFETNLLTPGSGEILDPRGLAIDGVNDLLYVSDGPNHRVVAFDVSGADPVAAYQAPGGPSEGGHLPTQCPGGTCPIAAAEPGTFEEPGQIALYGGEVYVVDSYNTRIQVFNPQLEYQRTIVGLDWEPLIPDVDDGKIPTAIAINPTNGNLLVGLNSGSEIQEFNPAGSLIRTLPVYGGSAIALDYLNNVLYSADGSQIGAFDYLSGADLAIAWDVLSDFNSGNINNIAVQPVERQLLAGFWYECGESCFDADIINRFGYDAAPTCAAASVAASGVTPVTFSLSCTDTSAAPQVTYELISQPSNGTISGFSAATGALTYTAASNENVADSFTYRARSLTGVSNTYTSNVTVGEAVPVIRQTANLERSSGDIFVKLPGTDTWVKLEKDALVPVGTIIDAANGYCVLTFANADGSLYTGTFWGGVFQILQGDGNEPYAVLKLRDDEFPGAPSQSSGTASASSIRGLITSSFRPPSFKSKTAAKKGKKKNKLWGKGKGKFRTSGDGSSASVRGTRWGVTNYANGTVTQVTSGVVVVRDFYRKKSITLRRGQSYFADKNWKKNRATARAKPRFTG